MKHLLIAPQPDGFHCAIQDGATIVERFTAETLVEANRRFRERGDCITAYVLEGDRWSEVHESCRMFEWTMVTPHSGGETLRIFGSRGYPSVRSGSYGLTDEIEAVCLTKAQCCPCAATATPNPQPQP